MEQNPEREEGDDKYNKREREREREREVPVPLMEEGELDFASQLLEKVRVEKPWVPPKTWESIPSESGRVASGAVNASAWNDFEEPTSAPMIVSETVLVRLALDALQGVKSSLDKIHKASSMFSLSIADCSLCRNPKIWHRSSSMPTLGKLLKSIGHSGLVFSLLCKFVNYFLGIEKEEGIENKNKYGSGSKEDTSNDELSEKPPFTLVNQAFAVAVKKILEGYICALNTIFTSVEFRRSSKVSCRSGSIQGAFSKITLLEVYLHTRELRTRIEMLGHICGMKIDYLVFDEFYNKEFSSRMKSEYNSFPRGADLLTYLYVQIRDADPVHLPLLKFLFLRAYEPYSLFIQSWIFKGRINDPYEEFFIEHSCKSDFSCDTPRFLIKERDHVSVPCFLRHVCTPLLRAGQQLLVLMKLQDLYNSFVDHVNLYCELMSLEDVLPCWRDSFDDSASCFCNLSFRDKDAETMLRKREIMYGVLYEKLRIYFEKLETGFQPIRKMLISYGDILFYSDDSQVPTTLGEKLPSSPSDEVCSRDANFTDTDSSCTSDDSLSSSSLKKTSEDSATKYESNSSFELKFLHDIPFKSTNFPPLVSQASDGPEKMVQTLNPSRKLQALNFLSERMPGSSVKKYIPPDTTDGVSLNLEMPFCKLMNGTPKCNGYSLMNRQLNPISASQEVEGKSVEPQEREKSGILKLLTLDDFKLDQSAKIDAFYNSDVVSQLWTLECDYDLSKNPVLAKLPWLHGLTHGQRSLLPYFDFSFPEDPSQMLSRRLFSPSQVKESDALQDHVSDNISVYKENESEFITSAPVSSQTPTDHFVGNISERLCGGAGWESSMMQSCVDVQSDSEGRSFGSVIGDSDLPIDVVIDKCVVQGILHQYAYISNFTIKLLEDGFGLHGHLSALRRYYFMELADWADSFLSLLCNHNWSASSPGNLTAEIQRFLLLALQRSSCESDPHHERLYIYEQVQGMMALPFSTIGTFDFIGLGYKVDWPINIIVTKDALKAYSEIFSFLMEVRLGVFSLSSTWHSLKALEDLGGREARSLKIFLRIRQRVNHFVSSLQQYLQSQLSDVSWCGFLLSLKQQVNDVMDLESMHMSYLADAQNICFLSAGSGDIATIIKNILQCALDLKACLKVNPLEVNFPKALAVQLTFEKSLRELYLLYLRSPKHNEFSLCRFWSYLDYNTYYSNQISQGISS